MMKIVNPYTATLAAALLLGGAPALASADEIQSGPVQLDNVQFNQTLTPDQTYDPGMARIAFTNTGSMPATEVVFAVKSPDGNVVDEYDASGTFAPGITISKNFPSTQPAPENDVSVESVTYADGSVWINPDSQLAASDTQAAPASSAAAPSDNAAMPNDAAPAETAPGSAAPNPQY